MSVTDLRDAADELAGQLVEWRRDLHRHPELGFDVHRTATFVGEQLERLGLEVRRGIGRTGVVGLLRARVSSGPAVLLRADMDALPIQEVAGRDYGSTAEGKMHACGHDGHTAMLLGAATLLADRQDRLARDVVFCFQPAEEGGGGGRLMVEDGVLDVTEIGQVYGLHLWSPFEAGTVGLRAGAAMAAQDEFTIRIRGRGGHGAQPHENQDPIVAAAAVITALQTVVARNVNPNESAVITVGGMHAGSAGNITPDHAELEGTLRSFSEEVRLLLRRRVEEIVEGISAAHGCEGKLELRPGYPTLVNDAAAVEVARVAAEAVFGPAGLIEHEPLAASEDFSYFLQQRPGAFVFVGAGNQERGITAPHHSPRFDIDESVLPRGSELLSRLALAT